MSAEVEGALGVLRPELGVLRPELGVLRPELGVLRPNGAPLGTLKLEQDLKKKNHQKAYFLNVAYEVQRTPVHILSRRDVIPQEEQTAV